jgi:hypothetical protein
VTHVTARPAGPLPWVVPSTSRTRRTAVQIYRQLDPQQIHDTALTLERRISERFTGSGLSQVACELVAIAQETKSRIEALRSPHWGLRIGAWTAVLALVGIAVVAPVFVQVKDEVGGIIDLMQGLEAGINNLVFVAIAVWFLVTFESRPKRKAALAALHELRSIAHIIDMHQLTKDPEHVLTKRMDTASSPQRAMSRFELSRYLDYCSEMLSITSKLAAVYAQYLNDSMVLDAVNDVETLTDGLSQKIWQKIMILDSIGGSPESPSS